jgi:hypothetical protein
MMTWEREREEAKTTRSTTVATVPSIAEEDGNNRRHRIFCGIPSAETEEQQQPHQHCGHHSEWRLYFFSAVAASFGPFPLPLFSIVKKV